MSVAHIIATGQREEVPQTMYVIKDELQSLWAHFCPEGGEHVCWGSDVDGAAQFETAEAAEAQCIAFGIDPTWVVAL